MRGKWVARPAPKPHRCRLPLMWARRPGWMWQCGTCGDTWIIMALDSMAGYYRVWRPTTATERRGVQVAKDLNG